MSGDPGSLPAILSQIDNPNPEIAQMTLQATRELRNKDAIPTLEKEMTYSRPPEELVELKKTIEFLQLPSFGSGGQADDVATQQ
jgi:hypothetical protein